MPEGLRLWMPRDASVPDDLEAWRPFERTIFQFPRGQQFLRVIGRMKPGVTRPQASDDVAEVGRQIGREYPQYGQAPPVLYAVDLQSDVTREIRPAVLALFGGVTLLLAMACVNVASLLVARAAARRRETAMRAALGAPRWRLFRQCVLEGLILALLGGIAGLGLAAGGVRLLIALRPEGLNRIANAGIDVSVLTFTTLTALAWGLLFSLAPAAETLRTKLPVNLRSAVQLGGRSVAGSPVDHRVRRLLVLVQIAVGVVLLVSAGLLLRAFVRLQHTDLGFRADSSLTFRIATPRDRYPTTRAINEFSSRLLEALRGLPGVTAVGGISHLPFDGLPNWSSPYLREGTVDVSLAREADARAVTPGYFEAVRATLVHGRTFTDDDEDGQLPVAIVDELLAERTWPGERAIGKRLLADPGTTGSPRTVVTVVGVVRHLRHRTPAADVREQLYFPQRQAFRDPMAYVVRARSDASQLAAPVRRVVERLDPAIPVYDVRPLTEYVRHAQAVPRFTMLLAGMFAGVALLLACVGVHGVIAYSVTHRRQEFAIRLALGARRFALLRLVIHEAFLLAVVGVGAGLVGSIAAASLLRSQLYGVGPRDPSTYGIVVPALMIAVVASALAPALRATHVRALESLRTE
jgi:predicted permease